MPMNQTVGTTGQTGAGVMTGNTGGAKKKRSRRKAGSTTHATSVRTANLPAGASHILSTEELAPVQEIFMSLRQKHPGVTLNNFYSQLTPLLSIVK